MLSVSKELIQDYGVNEGLWMSLIIEKASILKSRKILFVPNEIEKEIGLSPKIQSQIIKTFTEDRLLFTKQEKFPAKTYIFLILSKILPYYSSSLINNEKISNNINSNDFSDLLCKDDIPNDFNCNDQKNPTVTTKTTSLEISKYQKIFPKMNEQNQQVISKNDFALYYNISRYNNIIDLNNFFLKYYTPTEYNMFRKNFFYNNYKNTPYSYNFKKKASYINNNNNNNNNSRTCGRDIREKKLKKLKLIRKEEQNKNFNKKCKGFFKEINVPDDFKTIWEHWNSLVIQKHRTGTKLESKARKLIKSFLKKHSSEEIMNAMTLYQKTMRTHDSKISPTNVFKVSISNFIKFESDFFRGRTKTIKNAYGKINSLLEEFLKGEEHIEKLFLKKKKSRYSEIVWECWEEYCNEFQIEPLKSTHNENTCARIGEKIKEFYEEYEDNLAENLKGRFGIPKLIDELFKSAEQPDMKLHYFLSDNHQNSRFIPHLQQNQLFLN